MEDDSIKRHKSIEKQYNELKKELDLLKKRDEPKKQGMAQIHMTTINFLMQHPKNKRL